MAVGKKCGSRREAKKGGGEADLGLGLFGRKPSAVFRNIEASSKRIEKGNANSSLESLPQDVLIRILCGVDHDDLEQLVHVSQTIREAAWVAKQCHFAYSTPTKNRSSFGSSIEFVEQEIKTPDAPRRRRWRVGLEDDESWPRKELFV